MWPPAATWRHRRARRRWRPPRRWPACAPAARRWPSRPSTPLAPATRNRAVPAAATLTGKRTSTRSLAGTLTRTPAGVAGSRLAVCSTTSTSIGASVWFCTTTGQLEAVADVGEARRRRADHQRQAGGDVRLGRAELLGAGGGDDHDPVARQVVRQVDVDGCVAGGVGGHRRQPTPRARRSWCARRSACSSRLWPWSAQRPLRCPRRRRRPRRRGARSRRWRARAGSLRRGLPIVALRSTAGRRTAAPGRRARPAPRPYVWRSMPGRSA